MIRKGISIRRLRNIFTLESKVIYRRIDLSGRLGTNIMIIMKTILQQSMQVLSVTDSSCMSEWILYSRC